MVALMVMIAELPNTVRKFIFSIARGSCRVKPCWLADQGERLRVDVRLRLEATLDHDEDERSDEQQQHDRQYDDHQCVQNLGASADLTFHYAATSPFLPKYTCSMPITAQTMKRTNASA